MGGGRDRDGRWGAEWTSAIVPYNEGKVSPMSVPICIQIPCRLVWCSKLKYGRQENTAKHYETIFYMGLHNEMCYCSLRGDVAAMLQKSRCEPAVSWGAGTLPECLPCIEHICLRSVSLTLLLGIEMFLVQIIQHADSDFAIVLIKCWFVRPNLHLIKINKP